MFYNKSFKMTYLALLVAIILVAAATSGPSSAAASTTKSAELLEVSPDAQLAKYLEQSSILYGLTAVSQKVSIDNACYQQLTRLQQDILLKKIWALKVLDASGTKPDGFTYGNNFLLGSRQLCESLKVSTNNKSSEINKDLNTIPFPLSYRMIYIQYESPFKVNFIKYFDDILQLGLCLPSVCSLSNIQALTTEYLNADLYTENQIFNISSKVLGVKDLNINANYYEKGSFKIVCAYLVVTVLMVVCAACLSKPSADKAGVIEGNVLVRVVHCFDLQTNLMKLFTINPPTNKDISVINGLHATSAGGIVFMHLFYFTLFGINNRTTALWYFDNVSPAALVVDVFFTVSGFLYAYHFLNNTKLLEIIQKNNIIKNVGLFINLLIGRLLRIAPSYYFIALLGDPFFTYIKDVSIFHSLDSINTYQGCAENSWRNFFFIQNLWDWDEMCVNWTWYLACEMQFFVCASILLICYAKRPGTGKALMCFILLGNILSTFHTISQKNIQINTEGYLASMGDIYINPIIRILPYMGGLILGICLNRVPQTLFNIFRKQNFYVFITAGLSIVLYGYLHSLTSMFAAAIAYFAIRCCITVSVSYFILRSIGGSKSWLVRAMQAKIFQHLSRFSYAIYLTSPMMIMYFFGMLNTSFYFTLPTFLLQIPGALLLSYLTAMLFVLFFESPYRNLAGLIFKQKN